MGNRIDQNEWLVINGDRQNIRILSEDDSNPVVLFLHGGPGLCDRHEYLRTQRTLSANFTLIFWDQRASGKSCHKKTDKELLTLEIYYQDTVTMIETLCQRFRQEKVILVGHSWGSALGVQAAKRLPERIAAYVGIGQVIDMEASEMLSYEFCLAEAKKAADAKAIRALESLKPQQGMYQNNGLIQERAYVCRYGGSNWKVRRSSFHTTLLPWLCSSEYSIGEVIRALRTSSAQTERLCPALIADKEIAAIRELDVPVLLTIGRHDYQVPSAPTAQWFRELTAPYKEWAWFEESAHTPQHEEPEKWAAVFRDFVSMVK